MSLGEGRVRALHRSYLAGDVSPVEIAQHQLKAIETLDREVNAFCLIDAPTTIRMAQEAEERYRSGNARGPLDGVPISIKDTVNVAGWPTRRGSRAVPAGPQPRDAISIRRLRESGAVFLGKTTTPEFAWKGVTDSTLFGTTKNPLDLSLTPGGSSGGAGAAIALGLGGLAIGTDAAGSVRIPAAFCGVVGFKPTFGRIPVDPFPKGFSQLPHIGTIAATVMDAAIGASIMGGPAGADWTSMRQAHGPSFWQRTEKPVHAIRIGIETDAAGELLSAAVLGCWKEFLAHLHTRFGRVHDIHLPFSEARDVVALLYRIGCADAVREVAEEHRGTLDCELLEFIAPVQRLSAEEILALYRRREEIATTCSQLLAAAVDVVVTPTLGVLPPSLEELRWPGACVRWLDWNIFTPMFNLSHGPAVSVPWPNGAGPPIGIQIAAAPGRDHLVLRVAQEIERFCGYVPARLAGMRQKQVT